MKTYCTTLKLLCAVLFLICVPVKAQVTIGSNHTPRSGSLLDLKQNENLNSNSTKGLLMPRVALEDVVKMGPCVKSDLAQPADKQAHIGLVVYNITDSISVGLCPGLYVWTGEEWNRLPKPCDSGIGPEMLYGPNCYIVAPGQVSEEIPIAKAYLVSESRSDLTDLNRSDNVYVEVLWQDTQNLIDKVELVDGDKGIYSKFKVTTKGSAEGNALVALHVGPNGNDSDPIVWSWHIWVTAYNPDGGGAIYAYNNSEKDYVFMDRNIGALNTTPTDPNSMGMMYQWGRKDPFTPAAGNWTDNFRPLYSHPGNALLDEVDEVLGNGNTQPSGSGIKHEVPPSGLSNLGLSIQNPMTYYYGTYIKDDHDYIFDWFSGDNTGTVKDNELWGTAAQKSPFDPCPAGWRVPDYSATKSPWYPYVDPSSWNWDGTEGLSPVGSNGYNLIGTASRTPLGYYPACFARAPKAFFTGGPVGISDEYPHCAGGTFMVFSYGTVGGQDLIESHYWTSSVSDNINAKMMSISITGFGGEAESREELAPKASGAFVRCVKE